jgi:Tfp pilus assembly protein PilF
MAPDARSGRFAATGSPVMGRPWRRFRALGRAFALVGVFALVLGSGGCSQPAPKNAADRAARAQQLIDAGNDAYHQGDYRLAVRRYAAAAVVRKDDPAAYYGMGMALSKLGRDEEARAAYQRARDLTQAAGGKPAGGAADVPPEHP